MNIETNNAYELAKKALAMLESVYCLLMDTIERKANAEVNLDSVTAQVMAEKESQNISKTALKDLVKGDERVIKAKAELILASMEAKKHECRVDYLTKLHDLEKKRMSAEIEDSKRIPLEN